MALSVHNGDLQIVGRLVPTSMTYPDGSIDDDAIEASANIDATKVQHQYHLVHSEDDGANASAVRKVVHVCNGTGTIVGLKAGSAVAATGDSTVTIDFKKNGSTVLSSAVVLDNANTAYVTEDGTLSVTTLAANDYLEFDITVSAGTGTLPTGLYVQAIIRENPQ